MASGGLMKGLQWGIMLNLALAILPTVLSKFGGK